MAAARIGLAAQEPPTGVFAAPRRALDQARRRSAGRGCGQRSSRPQGRRRRELGQRRDWRAGGRCWTRGPVGAPLDVPRRPESRTPRPRREAWIVRDWRSREAGQSVSGERGRPGSLRPHRPGNPVAGIGFLRGVGRGLRWVGQAVTIRLSDLDLDERIGKRLTWDLADGGANWLRGRNVVAVPCGCRSAATEVTTRRFRGVRASRASSDATAADEPEMLWPRTKGGQLDLIETIRFDKAEDLFDHIVPWRNNPDLHDFVFRGHGQESYELVPTALRPELSDWFWELAAGKPINHQWQWDLWQVRAEYSLLRRFYRLADRMGLEVPPSPSLREDQVADMGEVYFMLSDRMWISPDLRETAALAQHYGVPTRLLDWTYDLYVALRFAFEDAIGKDGCLAVWALDKEHLTFLKGTVNRVTVEFIVPHYANNPNLSAQQGLFSLWPIAVPSIHSMARNFEAGGQATLVDRRPLDALIGEQMGDARERNVFKKFVLPCSEAVTGCRILERLGYGAARLFPGYGGVAKQILSGPRLRGGSTRRNE